jgi:hypothetical protein
LLGFAAACVLLGVGFAELAQADRGDLIDPVGVWNCLVYGRPAIADQRVFLELAADGSAAVLRLREGESVRWTPISNWHWRRKQIEFGDAAIGRTFEADLERPSLGGSWRTGTRTGGWWCVRIDRTGAGAVSAAAGASAWLTELEPSVIATPLYPTEAIRAAKEGRAVGCFFVDSTGEIIDPVVVELSDEVFRAPTLVALARSRYRGWEDDKIVRPDCRSFIFRLGKMGSDPIF